MKSLMFHNVNLLLPAAAEQGGLVLPSPTLNYVFSPVSELALAFI